MIKVMVPNLHGGKERRESHGKWVGASPHILSSYPIYPQGGPQNLDIGVTITRGRDHWRESVLDENSITIDAYGGTQVFIGDHEVTNLNGNFCLIGDSISVFESMGKTRLKIKDGSGGCVLSVIRSGEKVAEAKLVIASENEAKKIRSQECAIEQRWLGAYADGTSDFL